MDDIQEKTLAKLSITALLLDGMIVFSIWYMGQPFFEKSLSRSLPVIADGYIVMFPVLVVVHLFLVEVVFGGWSFGRFCTGLVVSNRQPAEGSVTWRVKRFLGILFRFGLGSLNPNRLPGYNCSEDLLFKSDLAGEAAVRSRSRPASRPSKARSAASSGSAGHARATTSRAVAGVRVLSGAQQGLSFRLDSGRSFPRDKVFRVGRDPAWADLVLTGDLKVSSRHCRIVSNGESFQILDGDESGRKSTNGTLVSGRPVPTGSPVRLQSGDILQVGQTEIQFN